MEETFAIIFLLAMLVLGLFSIIFYIVAGMHIVKDAPKHDQNVGAWAVAHFVGYFFFGTWPFGIYQIVTKKTWSGVFWIALPFFISFVLVIFLMIIGAFAA